MSDEFYFGMVSLPLLGTMLDQDLLESHTDVPAITSASPTAGSSMSNSSRLGSSAARNIIAIPSIQHVGVRQTVDAKHYRSSWHKHGLTGVRTGASRAW